MQQSEPKAQVLLVDDAPENLQFISGLLYERGVNVAIAQTGADALESIARKLPDLILLDIVMPEMDGFEVCRRLKADPATNTIPVIFLTARDAADDIVNAFQLGAVDYITKPFRPEELLARVFTHLELKHARDLQVQQKEQQYRRLAESVADGIGIVQDGKLVFVNPALAEILGLPAEQLLGQALLNLVRADYQAEWQQTHTQLDAGADDQQWLVLQCMVSGDGREVWIEGRHSLIEWEGRPATLISMRDISHHKIREFEIEKEKEALRQQNLQLKTALKDRYRFGEIIGKSSAMQAVYELIVKAAASDASVLISGESGTGKELIASTIHHLSKRQPGRFVPVNCGAIPEELFESAFFGHRKGAFTGAHRDQAGLFEAAEGGTLFLDELEALRPAMQTKLLRAIDGGGYLPVGGQAVKTPNVRMIAATNIDVSHLLQQGLLREDFFYRLYVIAITIPPLRDRREDLPLLLEYFLRRYGPEASAPALSGQMLKTLYDYDWPGNVRELQNTVQRFVATGQLDFVPLPRWIGSETPEAASPAAEPAPPDFEGAVAEFERHFLRDALALNRWHRGNTARQLGLTERTLYRKMRQYGLKEYG